MANQSNNVDAAINPAPLVSRSSVRSASIVHPTTGFAANAETATSSAADQSTECEIFEMTQYDDLSTVVEKRKISRTAAIEWMKDDFDKASTGKLQNASAKIVFLQLSLADPTFLDFLDTLLSAAQIDKRLWEDLSVFSLGVRIVENRSIGSSHSRLSFYSPATTSSARVAWSFDTKCGTRAILLDDYDPGEYGNVNGSAQTFVKNQISLRHPLFLSISLRGILLAELQSRESSSSAILGHVEKNIGYDAFIPIESEADGLDLAEYSKQVGKDMNIMGMSKAILSLQISAREHLTSNDSYKLDKCFPGNETETYKKLCETVIRLDDNIEQQMRILRVELAATQERAKTLLTVLFNLIARRDVNASIELAKDSRTIALATKNDSSSMKTIAVMTMLFLPATFFAALFSTPMLDWQTSGSQIIQPRFWIYWAFTIPCTAMVLISWYFITKRQKALEAKEDLEEREKVMKRDNTVLSSADATEPAKFTLKQKAQTLNRRLPRWRQDVASPTA